MTNTFQGQHSDDAAPTVMSYGWRETDVPIEPLSLPATRRNKAIKRLVEHAAEVLHFADDEAIRAPLWDLSPSFRPAVIHERRRRWGIDDDEGEN